LVARNGRNCRCRRESKRACYEQLIHMLQILTLRGR
jgi:hypothetical protein